MARKKALIHPLTKAEYTHPDEYVQALIDSYAENKQQLFNIQNDEAVLVRAFDEMVERPEVIGTFTLIGVTHVCKVQRRVNIKYDRERGAEHPLRVLLGQFDELGDMIRVSYEESGAKIQNLIDKVQAGKPHSEDDKLLVEQLLKYRVQNPGKPAIEIAEQKVKPGGKT